MKKLLTALLLLATVFCGAIALAACEECTHDFGEWETVTAATCEEAGVRAHTCKICNERVEEVIPAQGHLWDEEASHSNEDGTHTLVCSHNPEHVKTEKCEYLDSVVAPTCDEDGYTEHICPVCDHVKRDTPVEKLGHQYGDPKPDPEHPGQHIQVCANDPTHVLSAACEYEENTVLPGCETKGYTSHFCTLCGDYFEDDVKEPLEHKWEDHYTNIPGTHTHGRQCLNDPLHIDIQPCEISDNVVEPTCEEDGAGYTEHRCADCELYYRDEDKPRLDHDWQDWQHDTNTSDGTSKHYHVCSRNPEHREEFACEFADAVTAPTCYEGGNTTRTCVKCEYHYISETTEQLQHIWGAYLSDKNGYHSRTCTRQDCPGKETVPCEYNETNYKATCTTDSYTVKVCKEPTCQYTERVEDPGTALGHLWEGDGVKYASNKDEHLTHTVTCGRDGCDETQSMSCEFDVRDVASTCTSAGYTDHTCKYCHDNYHDNVKELLPHTYAENWTPVEDYREGHKQHTRSCTECHGAPVIEDCQHFHDVTTDATCYLEGKKVTHCDVCDGTTSVTIQKTAHSWGMYQIGENGHYRICTVEECREREQTQEHTMKPAQELPTCERAGNNYLACEYCGHVQDENGADDIPALGHKYEGAEWHYDADNPDHHYRICTVCKTYRDEQPCVKTTQTENATCAKAEKRTHTCTTCQHAETETVGLPLGCDYGTPVPDGTDHQTHTATCLRSDCDNPEGRTKTSRCSYDGKTTDATCTDDEFTVYTCSECNDTYQVVEQDSATGHSYGSAYENKKNGTHSRTCSTCRFVLVEPCEFDAGVVTKPTCTKTGYTTKTCTFCKYQKQVDTVGKTPHTWSSKYTSNGSGSHYRTCTVCRTKETSKTCTMTVVETKAASCTSEGYTLKTCKTCQYSVKTDTKAQLEHQWTLLKQATEQSHNRTHTMICQSCSTTKTEKCTEDLVATEATCTEPLRHHHVCLVCKSVYDHIESDALGHNRTTYTRESSGRHYEVCTRCGDALLQDCSGPQTKVVKPTCTVGGWTEYTCSKCGGEYTGSPKEPTGHDRSWYIWGQDVGKETHSHRCSACGLSESVPCVYVTTSRTEATCTKDGSLRKLCNTCTRIVVEKIEKLGHDFPENEWTPSGNGMQHYHMCRRPGCTGRQEQTCEMVPYAQSDAICQAPNVIGKACKKCGYSTTPKGPVEHNWSDWIYNGDGHHYKYCLRVGCEARTEEACSLNTQYSMFSCTTSESKTETCDVCHYTNTVITKQAPGHQWRLDSSDENGHQAQCTVCFENAGQGHSFEDSNICSVCKYDGLTYEQDAGGASYSVLNDNRVSGAENIIIPAYHDGFPVVGIKNYAFLANTAIVNVVLPRSITTIGDYAFSSCNNLSSVTFAEGEEEIKLESILPNAFSHCRLLSSFPFMQAAKLKTIDNQAFEDCGIQDIKIPDCVEHIGSNAFRGTKALRDWEAAKDSDVFYLGKHLIKVRTTYKGENGSFEIPATTLTVGAEAFADCTGITSLTLHTAVKYFGNDAFKGCTGLTSLEYKGSLGDWLAINFANDLASPLHYVSDFHIANVQDDPVIPKEGVTSIPAGTFRGSSALTTVTIPENITSIGARAFEDCVNLRSITIPDSVLYIGEDAFKGCKALIENEENWEDGAMYLNNHLVLADDTKIQAAGGNVIIRKGTVTINPKAFFGMKSLTYVSIPGSVYYIGEQAFSGSGLQRAKFEAAAEGDAGVQYFACNKDLNMGRWLDDEFINESSAAGSLTYYYQGYWKRTREGKNA